MITLTVIGSGSSGNCYLLQNEQEALVIEAGLPFDRTVRQALSWNTAKIKALIVSHRHDDHAKYAHFYAEAGIYTFALQDTIENAHLRGIHAVRLMQPGKGFKVGGFKVLPFPLQHYNTDGSPCPNVGFLITHAECGRICFFTDCESFTRQVSTSDGLRFVPYDFPNIAHWLMECNYDDAIINRSKHVPDFVKQRIKHSHMSLRNTLKVAKHVDLSSTREILLIHISDGNGDDRKFVREMRKATGKRVYAAHHGLTIDFSLNPDFMSVSDKPDTTQPKVK